MCQTAECYGYDISGYSNNGCFFNCPLCLCQPFVVHPFADSIEWQREQPLPDIKRQIDLGICDSQPNYKRNDKNNVFFLNGFVQKIIHDTYIKKSDQEPQRTIKCGDMMDAQFIKRYSLQPHAKIKYSEYQRIFPKGNKQPFCS